MSPASRATLRFAVAHRLNLKQARVVGLLAHGYRPCEIGGLIGLKDRTVKDRLRQVRDKIGAKDSWALLRQIYDPEGERASGVVSSRECPTAQSP